tara:strand:- start:215 stop:445 length:231 start_codon:yes stop_codon:yes gene_type:complete
MGKMKRIFQMFERNSSNDQVAWYLLMNTKIPNWEQAKQVAREMRNNYEQENDRDESENDSLEKGVKRTKDRIADED